MTKLTPEARAERAPVRINKALQAALRAQSLEDQKKAGEYTVGYLCKWILRRMQEASIERARARNRQHAANIPHRGGRKPYRSGKRRAHTPTTPYPKKKGSYQDGYQTHGSLAPLALFTGGKNFYRSRHFFRTFFYLCGIDAVTQPALPPKTPQNRAKSASRRAKTA